MDVKCYKITFLKQTLIGHLLLGFQVRRQHRECAQGMHRSPGLTPTSQNLMAELKQEKKQL